MGFFDRRAAKEGKAKQPEGRYSLQKAQSKTMEIVDQNGEKRVVTMYALVANEDIKEMVTQEKTFSPKEGTSIKARKGEQVAWIDEESYKNLSKNGVTIYGENGKVPSIACSTIQSSPGIGTACAIHGDCKITGAYITDSNIGGKKGEVVIQTSEINSSIVTDNASVYNSYLSSVQAKNETSLQFCSIDGFVKGGYLGIIFDEKSADKPFVIQYAPKEKRNIPALNKQSDAQIVYKIADGGSIAEITQSDAYISHNCRQNGNIINNDILQQNALAYYNFKKMTGAPNYTSANGIADKHLQSKNSERPQTKNKTM